MRGLRHVMLAAAILGAAAASTPAGTPDRTGIGVLGDSYSDEYQFYPPDRATAHNWVEILSASRGLNFGAFSTSGRGEPRNQGFAYNWARSDATTDDLIVTGQHTGLAAQVARGEVGSVVVFIGGNDFINAFKSPRPLEALERVSPRAVANFRTAFQTLRAADPRVRLVLLTVPDIRHLPEFAVPLREGRIPASVADAFTAAIAAYNAEIRATAAREPAVALVDFDRSTRFASRFSQDSVIAAGRKLDRRRAANDPDCFFLADARHPGTLGQALLAQMIVEALNTKFDARIASLSAPEALRLAGLDQVLTTTRALAGGPRPAP